MKVIKIKLLFLNFLLLCLISSLSAHHKGDDLRELLAKSKDKNGIIELNASSFKNFVLEHPRPYDVVILFLKERTGNLCEKVKETFDNVAVSVLHANGYNPDKNRRKRAVFFAVMYYSKQTKSIFKELKLSSKNSLLYTSPELLKFNDDGEKTIVYDEGYIINYYEDDQDEVMAHKLMEMINAKSGRNFEILKDPFKFMMYFFVFVTVLFFGFWLINNFPKIFLNQWLWYVGASSVFIVGIAGYIYSIQHKKPWVKKNDQGEIIEYFYRAQREQHALEGFIVSGLFFVTGTLFVVLSCTHRIKNYYIHKLICFSIMGLILYCSKLINDIYLLKASWYNPKFAPNDLTKGPLINDQGNSF